MAAVSSRGGARLKSYHRQYEVVLLRWWLGMKRVTNDKNVTAEEEGGGGPTSSALTKSKPMWGVVTLSHDESNLRRGSACCFTS